MSPNNILLMGGCGFVGRHLVNALNAEYNLKVHILDRIDCIDICDEKMFVGDVGDASFLADSIYESKPDIIYYLITNFAVNSVEQYTNALNSSIINLNNIFTYLKSGTRFIYIGSSAQYGRVPLEFQPVKEETAFNPVTNYGVFKAFEELEIRRLSEKFNIDTLVGRIFNLTGPGEPDRMVGGAFVSQLIEEDTLKVGNLFPKRDFLDIRDAVKALKLIGLYGKTGSTYNICSGKSVSIKDYLDLIINELKCSPTVEVSQNRINKNDINDLVGDNNKLRKLGWKPKYLLDQTVKDLVESYRNL